MFETTLEDVSGLPPECDGLELVILYDYQSEMLGGWDHPNFMECVDIQSIESLDGESLDYLMDNHKALLEMAVLQAHRDKQEDSFDFEF